MKVTFSALVFGSYERFIPYYICSINKSYPKADIVLFYLGKVTINIKSFVENYRQQKVILYEDFFTECNYKGWRYAGNNSK